MGSLQCSPKSLAVAGFKGPTSKGVRGGKGKGGEAEVRGEVGGKWGWGKGRIERKKGERTGGKPGKEPPSPLRNVCVWA